MIGTQSVRCRSGQWQPLQGSEMRSANGYIHGSETQRKGRADLLQEQPPFSRAAGRPSQLSTAHGIGYVLLALPTQTCMGDAVPSKFAVVKSCL
jgi:hypothetical protein